MSFNSSEVSEESGRPVFMFKFVRSGKEWRYTNADQNLQYLGNTYTSAPITMDSVIQSGVVAAETLKIQMPRVLPLAVYLDAIATSSEISVFVYKVHMTENSVDGGYANSTDSTVFWVGTYLGISRPSPSQRTLSFSSLTLARSGLRLSWLSGCPHILYGRGCNVNKATYGIETGVSITVVNGVTVSSSSFATHASGWFSGGFIQWETEAGVVESRGLETHVGSTCTVFGGTNGIGGGINYKIYAGCAHVPQVCDTKFSNMVNYGGINHLRGKSPFDGDPVF